MMVMAKFDMAFGTRTSAVLSMKQTASDIHNANDTVITKNQFVHWPNSLGPIDHQISVFTGHSNYIFPKCEILWP